MLGMLIGGFLWGTIGDKFGRLKVLFGSILMYSLFTFINAYVKDVNSYMWCRFLAGVGLAGELGAGITLVSEQISGKYRGFAVALVGGIGMFGAVTAGIVATFFSWKTSFIIGGLLGVLLLLLRFSVAESGLFSHMATHSVAKGNFWIVLSSKKRSWKFFLRFAGGNAGLVCYRYPDYIYQRSGSQYGYDNPPGSGNGNFIKFFRLCFRGSVMRIAESIFEKQKESHFYFSGFL